MALLRQVINETEEEKREILMFENLAWETLFLP
jgi:hypothetical protein